MSLVGANTYRDQIQLGGRRAVVTDVVLSLSGVDSQFWPEDKDEFTRLMVGGSLYYAKNNVTGPGTVAIQTRTDSLVSTLILWERHFLTAQDTDDNSALAAGEQPMQSGADEAYGLTGPNFPLNGFCIMPQSRLWFQSTANIDAYDIYFRMARFIEPFRDGGSLPEFLPLLAR